MNLLKITSFEEFKKVMNIIKGSYSEYKKENPESDVEDYELVYEFEDEIVEAVPMLNTKNASDLFFQDKYPKENLVLRDKIFLISTIFLGVFITIATFIWGIL